MIHCDKALTLAEIEKIKVETPEGAGGRWLGVPHADVLHAVLNEIKERNWTVARQRFAISPDKAEMAAVFDLDPVKCGMKGFRGFDLSPSIGVVSSNNRRKALKVALGATVNVCLNGLVTGEVTDKKHHTKNLDLEDFIEDAFDQYDGETVQSENLIQFVYELQHTGLSDAEKDHILMNVARSPRCRDVLVSWQTIREIDDEYLNPSFKEFRPRTLWSLLNAYTLKVKQYSPVSQPTRIANFLKILKPELVTA